jgi:hypothetical protein
MILSSKFTLKLLKKLKQAILFRYNKETEWLPTCC